MKLIKLLITDDSEIHIAGIKAILTKETDICITGETYTTQEAIESIRKECPDTILLDISLESETDGIDLAYYIYQNYPSVNVIILSHYKEINYIILSLRAHVRAYLAKDTKPDDLVYTIRAVGNGKGVFFGDTIAYKNLLNAFGNEANLASGKQYELTAREIQVVEYLSQGYSSKEIGALLHIDKNTIESHKEHIKNKLGVDTVVEVVVSAIKHGIIKA